MRPARRPALLLAALAVVVGLAVVPGGAPAQPGAGLAYPPGSHDAGTLLAEWWSGNFAQPGSDNPLLGAGDPCLKVGPGDKILAPAPAPGGTIECTVKPGTKVFMVGFTNECSTLEEDPFFADNPEDAA